MFQILVFKDEFMYEIWKITCPRGEPIINTLENILKRKKIVYFLLCKGVEGLCGELKVEQRAYKLKKLL